MIDSIKCMDCNQTIYDSQIEDLISCSLWDKYK